MPLTDVAPISASIEIAAPPAQVWALVSDLRNNRKGVLVWPTQSKVVRFVAPAADSVAEIAWRVKENFTIWSLRLEPTAAGGTRLISTREAPDGISDVSVRLTKVAFGGVPKFTSTLEHDMGETLKRIKATAERG